MALLLLALTAAAPRLPAQIIVTGALGLPAKASNPHLSTLSARVGFGVALPPVPHLTVFWNLASLGYDRLQAQNGASISTAFEAWVSPAFRPAQSFGPLLIGEAGVGRRFGLGLHGFTTLGAGLGWSLGDWIPYVEFRRRTSFHSGRPHDNEVLVGVHFMVFG